MRQHAQDENRPIIAYVGRLCGGLIPKAREHPAFYIRGAGGGSGSPFEGDPSERSRAGGFCTFPWFRRRRAPLKPVGAGAVGMCKNQTVEKEKEGRNPPWYRNTGILCYAALSNCSNKYAHFVFGSIFNGSAQPSSTRIAFSISLFASSSLLLSLGSCNHA